MYQVIDDFLPSKEYEKIKNLILHPNFYWNFCPFVTQKDEINQITASYYFTHIFWDGFEVKQEVKVFAPILNKLECKSILRIKANLYPSTEKIIRHDNHIDYEFPHMGAIYYINSNDGFTVLEDKIEVESVKNRLLIFDPSKIHHSTTCKNDQCRINVNFNFF